MTSSVVIIIRAQRVHYVTVVTGQTVPTLSQKSVEFPILDIYCAVNVCVCLCDQIESHVNQTIVKLTHKPGNVLS